MSLQVLVGWRYLDTPLPGVNHYVILLNKIFYFKFT